MNVFENVVRNEVQFTELFRNMCEYKLFRTVISDWIYDTLSNHDNIDRSMLNFNADEIQSQVTEEAEDNQSRPNM